MRKTKVATGVTSSWIPEIDFGYWALLYRASGLVDGLDLYSVWLGHSDIAIVEEYQLISLISEESKYINKYHSKIACT